METQILEAKTLQYSFTFESTLYTKNRPSEYDKITFYNWSSCLILPLGEFGRIESFQMTIGETHPTLPR